MKQGVVERRTLFQIFDSVIALTFGCAGVSLIGFSTIHLWDVWNPAKALEMSARLSILLESIGQLTIAVAALELSQTVIEEEVMRKVQMSAPTRVRRFLSRFMIVIVVSLSIETLVVVFKMIHEDPAMLPRAASIGFATAALLVGWDVFIWLNRAAEELEPEAMEKAKREDVKVE